MKNTFAKLELSCHPLQGVFDFEQRPGSAKSELSKDLNTIKKLCAEKNIKLHFLFGKYDRIILSKRAAIFQDSKNISIKIIDAGHQLLREKYAKDIIALLND